MNILILAGGVSKRMGCDKSLIMRPDGRRQIDHITALAQQFSDSVFLSLREKDSIATDLPIIEDIHPGEGPVAALESAAATCGGPLLVIGCDLFLLDMETIARLITRRDPARNAVCFRNRIDGRAEPLCAIYESSALGLAAKALADGQRCARRFLESMDPLMLDLPHPAALDNANTPGQLDECFLKLTSGVTPKKIRVLYFAKLREVRGCGEEEIETLACGAAGLYEEIRYRHRLPLELNALRVAINGEFADWKTRLSAGDEVVFIPPVAGG